MNPKMMGREREGKEPLHHKITPRPPLVPPRFHRWRVDRCLQLNPPPRRDLRPLVGGPEGEPFEASLPLDSVITADLETLQGKGLGPWTGGPSSEDQGG